MIGVAARQLRTQAAVALGALVVVIALAALTGPHLADLYRADVSHCAAHGDCQQARFSFLHVHQSLRNWLGVLVIVTPAVMGIFWGAPLVAREIETGTFRLAWTQSVTRTRWLTVKVAVVTLAAMLVAGLVSLTVTWWAHPFDQANMSRFGSFDERDIVPVGLAAFAVALGVTAGLLIRRTLPAMATTLVVYVATRLSFIHLLRPHLMTPKAATFAFSGLPGGAESIGVMMNQSGTISLQPGPVNLPNAWIISSRFVNGAGQTLTSGVLQRDCPAIAGRPAPGPGPGSGSGVSRRQVPAAAERQLDHCIAKVGQSYHELVSYQPGSRYWAFQWYEFGIFLAAALVLTGFCVWWLRRRTG